MSELPDHVRHNREKWDRWAAGYVEAGEELWAAVEPTWGIWNAAEKAVGMFPDDLAGKDAIELGCGTAYVSAWLARRGARPVGIDNSAAQLETARRLQKEHGLEFPLHHGNAEEVPCADGSFDFAISEYGAGDIPLPTGMGPGTHVEELTDPLQVLHDRDGSCFNRAGDRPS